MRTLQPVKASGWLNTNLSPKERELLIQMGMVPVNDALYPVWFDDSQIKLLRGGRGGGKSEVVADKLLDKCLTQPYFKCYYGRKVFENVRGSCFATLDAAIKKNKLDGDFSYSTANSSSMIITCKNGNTFQPFGSDRPDKLKSIKDPTHIWAEEFDQFGFEDFKELYPTLRTPRGENEFWGSFNSYSVFENHWILKYFYPKLYVGDDKPEFDILSGVSISDIFVNYTQNYFIDQKEYENKLKIASGGNDTIFQGLANGAWGVTDNKNPWLYNFLREKHVKPTLPLLATFPVYLSFDFNNDPFACTAWQFSPVMGGNGSFIHCLKEFSGIYKVEDMCSRIKSTFPASIIHITGDRSGQNDDIGRNQNLYQIIGGMLGVSDKMLDLNSKNLEHADSRLMLNTMHYHYPNVFYSAEGCPNLIRQCQAAKVNTDKGNHQLLKDREGNKNDEFDSMRYFFQTYFNEFCSKTYLKVLKK